MTIDGHRQQVGELPAVHEAWLPREHSLHRPRHGGRQLTALISALVFFTAPTVMWLVGMRPTTIENRDLAAFPSVSSGWGFFTTMDSWATDNLVFRAEALTATDWISRVLFGEAAPFDQGGGPPSGPLPGSPTDEQDTAPDLPEGPAGGIDHAGYRRVIEGADGWLYFGYDITGKCKPEKPLDETIQQLNKLRAVVEKSGRKFVLLAAPDKTTMVPEYLPSTYPGKDCASRERPNFWRKMTTLAKAMDLRPMLQATAEQLGRPVYFPQDTHWTHEGALAMIRVLAERIRPGITQTWQIDREGDYTAPADLPPLIGRRGENHATSYRFKPDGRTDRTQPGVQDLRRPVHRESSPIRGAVSTPTVVLGDSFSIAASPYLPAAFSDVTQLLFTTIASDPGLVARTIADNEVVVIEIVERNIAGGTPQLLNQSFIDTLGQELSKRPVR